MIVPPIFFQKRLQLAGIEMMKDYFDRSSIRFPAGLVKLESQHKDLILATIMLASNSNNGLGMSLLGNNETSNFDVFFPPDKSPEKYTIIFGILIELKKVIQNRVVFEGAIFVFHVKKNEVSGLNSKELEKFSKAIFTRDSGQGFPTNYEIEEVDAGTAELFDSMKVSDGETKETEEVGKDTIDDDTKSEGGVNIREFNIYEINNYNASEGGKVEIYKKRDEYKDNVNVSPEKGSKVEIVGSSIGGETTKIQNVPQKSSNFWIKFFTKHIWKFISGILVTTLLMLAILRELEVI